MKGKLLGIVGMALIVWLASPVAARADFIWTFYNLNGATNGTVLASPQTVSSTPAGFTVTLTAIADTTNLADHTGVLFVKDLGIGSDDRGVGVCRGSAPGAATCAGPGDGEIVGTEALRVDLPAGLSNVSLQFSSLLVNEVAHVWAGSVGGTSLGTVTQGPGDTSDFASFAVPNGFDGQSLFVTADTNDFLVYGMAGTAPVPEPGTLMLLGSGLLGLGGFVWRRKSR